MTRRIGFFVLSLLAVGLLPSAPAAGAGDLSTVGGPNLTIDLLCRGTLTASSKEYDQDVGEQSGDNPGIADCIKPLNDPNDVFTAIVKNARGRAVKGVRIDFEFGQRINGNAAGANNSTNDATLTGSPGEQTGTGGFETRCFTGKTGRCSATLVNPTPQSGDTIEVTAVISGPASSVSSDGATTQWQTGVVNGDGTLTLAPRAATNQIGTQHTVTATVRNQFGQPVQGANVDFSITAGANAGLAQAGMTDAVTDANGAATFTYTSNVTSTDTIFACSETGGSENDNCNLGEPRATAFKTWQTGPVVTNGVALDMDADDGASTGSSGSPGWCELTTAGEDTNRESVVRNDINKRDKTAAGNFHRICAAAFQNSQASNNGRLAGAQVTFTISGPGRIYAPTASNGCSMAARPPTSTSVTVTADEAGYAFACLYSQTTGRTVVTASSGAPAHTATGQKVWTIDGIIRHNRAISIGFDHLQAGQRLLIMGKLRLVDGEFDRCVRNQPVIVERRVDGRWVTQKSTRTNRRGRYAVEIADRTGKYRAWAPKTSITDLATNTTDVCVPASKRATHTH